MAKNEVAAAVMEQGRQPMPRAKESVYECIANVSADLATTGIAKTGRNQQQGYNFRGIDAVYNALGALLPKHGLVIMPRILERDLTERESKSGGVLFTVVVTAEFDFISVSDSSRHTIRTYGEAMDSADKATNKAMSAAYKYAAMMAFCIPTEGDNDADAATHEVAPRTEVSRQRDVQPETKKYTTDPNDTRLISTKNRDQAPGDKKIGGQLLRLHTLVGKSKRTDDDIKAYLLTFGFKSSKDITRNKYDEICDAVMAPGPLPGQSGETGYDPDAEPGIGAAEYE